MIRAYHFVPAPVLDDVLGLGRVEPGIMRIDPSIWIWDCQNRIRGLVDDMRAAGDPVDETALSAIHELVAGKAEELARRQRREGAEARQTKTEFQCLDFLAGDLERVFLAVHDWPWFAAREVSGLVFDAEELIWNGGVVRPIDLAETYDAEVRKILKKPWKSGKKAAEAVLEALEGVKGRHEISSSEALRFVGAAARGGNWPEPPELLWPEALPVDMAMEIWKNGERIQGPSLEGAGPIPCPAAVREFGRRISEFINSGEGYKLLPYPRATWTSGGCHILAAALGSWLGGAFPLAAVFDRGGLPQHVLLKVGDCHVDADGASTEEELVRRWETEEFVVGARVGPFDPAQAGEIDCPVEPTRGLVQALERNFGSGDRAAAELRRALEEEA